MGTKVAKQSNAEMRQQAQFKKRKQGWADGKRWLAAADPFEVRELVNKIGWNAPCSSLSPWKTCPFNDLRKKLRSEGRDYTYMFIQAVQNCFMAEHSALVFHRHREGAEDGRRWASEYANAGQLAQISKFARSFWTRAIFIGPDPCESWTPAHRLVLDLLPDAYPDGEDGKPQEDCTEFREFWQPFVNEPMDKVMSSMKLYGFRAGHKLQDRHYVVGFVDGALGLSEQIRQRLIDVKEPSPTAGELLRM